MAELLAVALVCAVSIAQAECTRDTALDIIVSPAASPYECARHAQATAASAGLPGAGHYLKVSCERRAHFAAEVRP